MMAKQPKRVPPDLDTMTVREYFEAKERYLQEEMRDLGWMEWPVVIFNWLMFLIVAGAFLALVVGVLAWLVSLLL